MRISHHSLALDTGEGVWVCNLTERVNAMVAQAGIDAGIAIVSSCHTTTALAINEDEARLLADVKQVLERLVPKDGRYLHNDIHLRDCPPDEPRNAHAHIAALLLGASQAIPVVGGRLALGTWQSLLFFELDGPRRRTVNVQLFGTP